MSHVHAWQPAPESGMGHYRCECGAWGKRDVKTALVQPLAGEPEHLTDYVARELHTVIDRSADPDAFWSGEPTGESRKGGSPTRRGHGRGCAICDGRVESEALCPKCRADPANSEWVFPDEREHPTQNIEVVASYHHRLASVMVNETKRESVIRVIREFQAVAYSWDKLP